MSQVILDSDEEEDVSIEEPSETILGIASDTVDACLPCKDDPTTGTPIAKGTSSSENLRRQMQIAQLALMEPTPSGKRHAADDFDELSDKPQDCSRIKRRKRNDAHEVEDQGALKTKSKNNTEFIRAVAQSTRGDEWEVPEDPSIEGQTFDGTKYADVQARDEQQQLAEQSPHDTIIDSSSVRHSASSRIETLAPADSALDPDNPNNLLPVTSSANNGTTSSIYTRSSGASAHVSISTPLHDLTEANGSERLNKSASQTDELQAEPPSNEKLKESSSTRSDEPVVVVYVKDNEGTQGHRKPASQGTNKRKMDREGSVDELDSDKLIGLPKETYKPRPTRSRDARKVPEHAVFALPATPVKKSNSKLKRLKTTGSIALAERTTLCEMGFRPSQADEALAEAEGDINRAVELLTKRGYEVSKTPKRHRNSSQVKDTTHDSEPGLEKEFQENPTPTNNHFDEVEEKDPVIATRRSKRGRGVAADLEDGDEDGLSEIDVAVKETTDVDEQDSTQERKPSHGSRRGKGRPKKQQISAREDEVKLGETEMEDSAGGLEENDEVIIVEAPIANSESNEPKKKGRGRPKKSPTAVDEIAECITVESDHIIETGSRAPLQECDANREKAANSEDMAPQEKATTQAKSTEITPEKNLKVATGSPKKPHSPLSSSKVPFKVGLSRRARIEPLLRIVKK